MKIMILASLLAGCGAHTDGDWAAARAHHCDEVDLLRGEVERAMSDWTTRFDAIPAMKESEQTAACIDAKTQLDRLSAVMQGFQRGAGALAYGRGERSVEAAGLSLDFGGLTLQRALLDVRCGPGNPYPSYAAGLRTTKAELAKRLDGAVGACTKVGWKSALPSSV